MTSMKIRTASLALVALSVGVGCRDMPVDMDTGVTPMDGGRDMGVGTDVVNPNDMGTTGDTGGNDVVSPTDGGTGVTIRQIQDITDPAHPAGGSIVTLTDPQIVALTPRILIGSVMGDSGGFCRFAVWIGTGQSGDFTGIQAQESIRIGDAGSCFNATPGLIPSDIAPGSVITSITNAQYGEFCGGATGIDRTMCRNWEQAQLELKRSNGATFVVGAVLNAPPATSATIADVSSAAGTMPGTRSLALEGALIQLSNVQVNVVVNDSGFPDFYVSNAGSATERMLLEDRNVSRATCIRNYLNAQNGMTLSNVTGILEPSFGNWQLHLRGPVDFPGLDCSTDGGTGTDAGGGG